MNTRLVNKIYRNNLNVRKMWEDFLKGENIQKFSLGKSLENIFLEVKKILSESDWVEMEDDLIYDNKVIGCWKGLLSNFKYKRVDSKKSLMEIGLEEYNYKNLHVDVPSLEEYKLSLTNLKKAPFNLCGDRPEKISDFIYKLDSKTQGAYYFSGKISNRNKGELIPFYRLYNGINYNLEERQILFLWVKNKLIPKKLKNNEEYKRLLEFEFLVENYFDIKAINNKKETSIELNIEELEEKLLIEDKTRADLKEYNIRMLKDTEQGHWSLWTQKEWYENPLELEFSEKLVARNPASSIKEGIVGIDFGTKSTVVVYQGDTMNTFPMRIGTGDLSKKIESYHYENPTIMEFNNLKNFMSDYQVREGRPYTKWKDLTVSHTAFNSLMGSKTDYFNTYIDELKQWAGDKGKELKIIDKNNDEINLPAFIKLSDYEINPIEIYAYYLGLYVNNMYNGIFMNYILSFPVTYETEIIEKIRESFYKGIKKSLPQSLHYQTEYINKLEVITGTSEPAAYAVTALQEYGFDLEDEEEVFYGVFDFGGGTTDFDFGIWRDPKEKKENRYDYVIEHFGAGGDKYLGGENLLELLAYEVFKINNEKLLKDSIQFILPNECERFIGSEALISNSREAKMNIKNLMEAFRPFWEGQEGAKEELEIGEVGVNLTDLDGKRKANYSLDIDIDKLTKILKTRIQKGVQNFFECLRISFNNKDVDLTNVKRINIFLAGNSSKSDIVKKLFEEEIEKHTKNIKNEMILEEENFFEVFPPLGTKDSDEKLKERGIEIKNDLGRPTGKTGVAFGLIDTRKGGDILVIDHNIKDSNINFKYYLGKSRKKKFVTVIDRETNYNEWVEFIDASEDTFEIYYTSQSIASTKKLPILDNGIKRRVVKINNTDENADVYIRIVNPTQIEYVVAYKNKLDEGNYLGEVTKLELN